MNDNDILLGGPPLKLFHSTLYLSEELENSDKLLKIANCDGYTCHNADKFYEKMQHATNCVCKSTSGISGATGSLCQAVQAGNLINTPPFNSMIELLTGPYSKCQAVIPPEKKQAAYNNFKSITGYIPPDVNQIVTIISDNQKSIANYTALYIFLILFTLCIIVLILLGLAGLISPMIIILLAVLAFFILYSISLAYSFGAQRIINDRNVHLLKTLTNDQNNFQNTVAYWPQGFFGVASVLTTGATGAKGATGATGATGIYSFWPCNGKTSNINACANNTLVLPKNTLVLPKNTSKVASNEFQLSTATNTGKYLDLSSNLALSELSIENDELKATKYSSLIDKSTKLSKQLPSKFDKSRKLTKLSRKSNNKLSTKILHRFTRLK